MNRILFVDDEPGILDGLRNSLRRQRGRWEMVFASSGADALTELAKGPFDLVVTDMRMPGMDGAELLTRVKAAYPATARIVLSGHAEQEAVLRTLPVAHQFLSKPCTPEYLCKVIERTCNLNALLHKDSVRRVIGALDHLPSLPKTYAALTHAMADPEVSINEIIGIVEQDPAMCVKILQLVNSAYFGLGQTMTSIRQAVTYLGMELLKALVLSAHIFSTMEIAELGGLCLDRLQQHSLRMARLLRRFLKDDKLAEAAFTTGLVHDIGEIVLACGFRELYADLDKKIVQSGRPCHLVEEELFGVTHAEVGAYLLGVWGLPVSIVEAVAYHHHPGTLDSREDCRLLAALHVADVLVCDPCDGRTAAAGVPELDSAFLARAVTPAQLQKWREIAAEEARQ